MFKIYDGRTQFRQWDTYMRLIMDELDVGCEVHFSNSAVEEPLTVKVYEEDDGTRVCDVPNILLTVPDRVNVYVYVKDSKGNRTTRSKSIAVFARPKPTDYNYTEREAMKAVAKIIERTATDIYNDQATSIGDYVFRYFSSLENIELPSVTSISNYAFRYCYALEALILSNNSRCTLSSTNALTSTPIYSGTGYIYVPAALIDSYKTATNWTTFKNKFRAIEDYPDICGEVTV